MDYRTLCGYAVFDDRRPKRYYAKSYGEHCATIGFDTIREARRWAESLGTLADLVMIRKSSNDQLVAVHRRDTNGDGRRWSRATV